MTTDVFDVIRTRKSIRNYLPTPVDEALLRMVMDAARLAPSGGNGQSWAFGIVRDEEKRKKLAQSAGNQMWIATAPVVIALCARLFLPQELTGYGREVNVRRFGADMLSHLENSPSPWGMALIMQNATPLIPGTHITLAARALGLDTCWIGDLNVKEASEILCLPEEWRCLFLMPLGYRAQEPKERGRKGLSEVVFADAWGKLFADEQGVE
jgi:nitroreductase